MTPQELVQAVQQLQQQVTEGRQRETQMRAQIEALRQTQTQQAAAAAGGLPADVEAAFTALATSQKELMDSLKHKDERRMSLVDTKGHKFTGKEESFLYWRTRLEAFITSVFGEFDEVLPWCEECAQTITETDIEDAWGEISPTPSHVNEIQAMNTQLFAVLQTLCEGEAFSIIRSAGKNCGLEAWRRLVRRYDPSTGGRRRTMLRHILNPQKCQKLDDVSNTDEVWEEQLRIYESRKRSDGTRHSLDDEIKVSILEHLCPTEIERRLQLNRSRYTTYQEVRAEVSLYLETRLGSRLKIGTAAHPDEATPMDTAALAKERRDKVRASAKTPRARVRRQERKGKERPHPAARPARVPRLRIVARLDTW